jgi:hypothetical protein
MVNNVAKTTKTLNIQLGGTTPFNSGDDITIVTGELGRGLLVFDSDGTLGVVSTFTNSTDFIITTHALSIDVNTILNLGY